MFFALLTDTNSLLQIKSNFNVFRIVHHLVLRSFSSGVARGGACYNKDGGHHFDLTATPFRIAPSIVFYASSYNGCNNMNIWINKTAQVSWLINRSFVCCGRILLQLRQPGSPFMAVESLLTIQIHV